MRHGFSVLDDGDLRSQAPVRLRKLHADRPATQDEQMLRQRLVGEDRFVGEVVDAVQSLDWRRRGRRPRGDDDAARPHPGVARRQHARLDEVRLGAYDLRAQPLEALNRIVRGNRGDDLVYVPVHRREIDTRLGRFDAERRADANGMRCLGRGEHRLGRDASAVQAFAAHFTAFDQNDARAELRGDRGGAETGGAGANDTQVDLKIPHVSFLLLAAAVTHAVLLQFLLCLFSDKDGDGDGRDQPNRKEGPLQRAAAFPRRCLAGRTEIDVKQRARHDADESGRNILNQLNVGDAVEVVLQVERHQLTEPEQADDLPAPFAYRLLYRLELGSLGDQRFDALVHQIARNEKRERRADGRGNDDQGEADGNAESQPCYDRQDGHRNEEYRRDDVDDAEDE